MKRSAFILVVLALVLVGCGGESATSSADTVASSDGGSGDVTPVDADTSSASGSEGQGSGGPGSAVLTIGDQVYTFDNYYCAEGSENTRNDKVPFSSGAFGEVDGNRAQLDASVYDPSEQGRMEGDGVSSSVTLSDIDDFENPVVDWSSGGPLGDPVVIEFDGSTVFVETTFDNDLTDEIENIPGTLEATCRG